MSDHLNGGRGLRRSPYSHESEAGFVEQRAIEGVSVSEGESPETRITGTEEAADIS